MTTYESAAEVAIDWAMDHLHRPYVLGGTGANGGGIDCSGMTQGAWAAAGYHHLDHYAAWQWYQSYRVFRRNIGNLRRGDLVFYDWNGIKSGPEGHSRQPGGPNHVNIYLGWMDGHQWCIQATTFGVPSEVIPMLAYEAPCGYGRVPLGDDWDRRSHNVAHYLGCGLDRKKWARFL